jgi:uncharacterized protein with NAD-binding domain and iron-sulfur cluster
LRIRLKTIFIINKMSYDLIIVGGGPSGLALAQCLCEYNKILIIDREPEIGGCHRVFRVEHNGEKIFTEHSPRIYSTSYKNFEFLLKDMNTSFYDLFTPYNFSMSQIGGETVFSTLNFSEIFKIGWQFFLLIFNNKHGMKVSMEEFMTKYNFKDASKQLIDRLTRLTDGAGADRYTLNEFLQLFNQQFLYRIYQPKKPNDVGLFKMWQDYLTSKGVTFRLSTEVKNIIYDNTTNLAKSITLNNNEIISSKKIVLAIPPESFSPILNNSVNEIKNCFMEYNDLVKYTENTAYMTYISFTFHWDTDLKLPKIYGFPRSSWGLAFILLTDYMTFEQSISKTVITCTFTYTDTVSTFLNKTANESTQNEILSEGLRQLKEAYPNLPDPTLSLLSPQMYYDNNSKKWICKDKAFIMSSKESFLPYTKNINNLYNVGTHNGKSKYKFTSMETAVSNAINLSHIIEPKTIEKYKMQNLFEMRDLMLIIFIFILTIIIYILIR